jgi:hypothetical protein
VYHPAFAGSYSLKAVLPALVPDMTYEGMAVANVSFRQACVSRGAGGPSQKTTGLGDPLHFQLPSSFIG